MKYLWGKCVKRKNTFFILLAVSLLITLTAIYFLSQTSSNDFPEEISLKLSENITMEFILIKEGSFYIGSEEGEGDEDETPRHKVTITKPFYMGKYEVTQEQWYFIMKNNPSEFKNNKNPVDMVSWQDCILFTEKLSTQTLYTITLPTEAQWEYVCRAGSTSTWFFGLTDESLKDYAWVESNSNGITHPVGLKKSNNWGLYDMYGNVSEWCLDWYENPYSAMDISNPGGPQTGESRVLRGGAWGDFSSSVRSAYRNAMGEKNANNGCGLRCIISLDN